MKKQVICNRTYNLQAGKGYPFPAYLQDVKCAIRFLKENSESYCIDPERVAIRGTSSGGNTALLVGLTVDDSFTCYV